MQKVVKITKARVNMANHDHFVLHSFCCAKLFTCNGVHKNRTFQLKNKRLSKSRCVMHSLQCVLKTEKVMATESEMRKAILEGMDPEKAYMKFRKF